MEKELGEIVFNESDDMTKRRLALQDFLKETPQEDWPTCRELGQQFKIPKSTVARICEKFTQSLPEKSV